MIDKAVKRYYARPFASWESETIDKFNGLFREYAPMKRTMKDISDQEIKILEEKLNNRSRKHLGFKALVEIFHESISHRVLQT